MQFHCIKMSQYFPKPFGGDINVKVDLSNYATKTDLKNVTGIDTSKLAGKPDFVSLKAEVDKLEIDKLKSVPTNSRNLKSKVDELDVDKLHIGKLETTTIDLSKLNDVVKNDVLKDAYNAKIKIIEDKIPDITNLATKTNLHVKINEVKAETSSMNNLATTTTTTTALTAVENEIPNVSN